MDLYDRDGNWVGRAGSDHDWIGAIPWIMVLLFFTGGVLFAVMWSFLLILTMFHYFGLDQLVPFVLFFHLFAPGLFVGIHRMKKQKDFSSGMMFIFKIGALSFIVVATLCYIANYLNESMSSMGLL